jgi:hypothetical protein
MPGAVLVEREGRGPLGGERRGQARDEENRRDGGRAPRAHG